ncbi:MAG: hypothetical protein QOD39_3097 [Mycobacterium sp.]|nr:hypothetical protein [Mycobacterium sp.]
MKSGYPIIALDVGGVIFYDQPYELAWIQAVWQLTTSAEPGFGAADLVADLVAFYNGCVTAGNVFRSPYGRAGWIEVRGRWVELSQPLRGAVEAVQRLSRNRSLCVVANQPVECSAALTAVGIASHLSPVALDSAVGYSKPDHRLLAWTIDCLGCDPRDMLVVGNREDHDVTPARVLGCATAQLISDHKWAAPVGVTPFIEGVYREMRTDAAASHASGADFVVTSLAELAELLDRT